jgi:hypothetical protein
LEKKLPSELDPRQTALAIRTLNIEPDFVCTACGKRGAEVRPKFSQARMGTG